jgi:hypothetical protein
MLLKSTRDHQKPCLGRGQICPRSAEPISTSSDIDREDIDAGNANVTFYQGPGPSFCIARPVEEFEETCARLSTAHETTNLCFHNCLAGNHDVSGTVCPSLEWPGFPNQHCIHEYNRYTLKDPGNCLYTGHRPLLLSPIIHCQSTCQSQWDTVYQQQHNESTAPTSFQDEAPSTNNPIQNANLRAPVCLDIRLHRRSQWFWKLDPNLS